MKLRSIPSGILLLFLLSETVAPAAYAQSAPAPQQSQPALTPAEQAAAQLQLDAMHKQCGFNPMETDEKKIVRTNQCMARLVRIRQQRLAIEKLAQATTKANATAAAEPAGSPGQVSSMQVESFHLPSPEGFSSLTFAPPGGSAAGTATAGAGAGTGAGAPSTPESATTDDSSNQPAADDGSLHSFYGGSLSHTPSTCGDGTAGMDNANLVRVHRSVLSPQTSSDDFGYRLGHRFIVYQVTVENGSKDYQFMLQDVSIDFSKAVDPKNTAGTYIYNASGQDLTMLRGVPEKGADLDPRNSIYHVLQGIGSVAGAVSGLTAFADVMGPAVAVFNGSFLQGYTTFAPDHSGTQLNRLSDSAFAANTVIDKQRAKTLALFIPMDEVLSRSEQKKFLKDPNAFISLRADKNLLNDADVCVDGTYIQAVTVKSPALTSVTLPSSPTPAPGVQTTLNIVGANMVAGDTTIVLSGATPVTAAVTVSSGGKAGSATVTLPSDFDPNKTTATLHSKSTASFKTAPVPLKIGN